MKYNGKSVEIIGSKTIFGKDTVWIRSLFSIKEAMSNKHVMA